jgi:hypothetical protein
MSSTAIPVRRRRRPPRRTKRTFKRLKAKRG